MIRYESICFGCDHFCRNNDDKLGMGCRAFPGGDPGIPCVIGDLHSHDKPFKDNGWINAQDNDYVYTPAKKKVNLIGNEIKIYQAKNEYADENGRYNGK